MNLRIKYSMYRKSAVLLAAIVFFQGLFPMGAWALTSGPTQPEFQSFEPVGTTEMVDLFTGDFTYNIPLFEVPGPDGGYPVNLFYNSPTSAEAEASMVGFGWNLGIGNISRQVRGLPDDFKGEEVREITDIKENWTAGVGISGDLEKWGAELSKTNTSPSLQLGLTAMYNNYKGIGFSIEPSIKATKGKKNESPSMSGSFGLSISSFDGVSANANVSIDKQVKNSNKEVVGTQSRGGGLSINSRRAGAVLTLSQSASGLKTKDVKDNEGNVVGTTSEIVSSSSGTSLSFENSTFTPQGQRAFNGFNLGVTFKTGGANAFGIFGTPAITGFYSEQGLKDRNKWLEKPAYGLLYAHEAGTNGLSDFNREKDWPIRPDQFNLPNSSTTADLLSVTGQGVGGLYQAYRSDYGVLTDPEVRSFTGGGHVSIELGGGQGIRNGVDANVNLTKSVSEVNDVVDDLNIGFKSPQTGTLFESSYYKIPGEPTAELNDESIGINYNHILGDEAMRLQTVGLVFDPKFTDENTVSNHVISATDAKRANRKPRSNAIQAFTNRQLLASSAQEILPEYQIKYFNAIQDPVIHQLRWDGLAELDLNRSIVEEEADKIAGYTVTNTSGSRWVYGLPAQNLIQKEVAFSVEPSGDCYLTDLSGVQAATSCDARAINHNVQSEGSDDYLNIVETPEYAHSYLLTSVLGQDYIDKNENGPDGADVGYWMRVDYLKTSDANNPYKWRAPFVQANYQKGFESLPTDDKGSFVYGEREQYYPGRISSKTHCAQFYYQRRDDGRGAKCWIENDPTANLGAYSYQLDSIVLYSKLAGVDKPIKTIVFNYNNDIWPGQQNTLSGQGKLTLERVYFKYEGNSRGRLSPYKFEYNSGPNYQKNMFDRWGVYRSLNECEARDFPYVNGDTYGPLLDNDIASWHLGKIHLPSGSTIDIDVGRDHYSHVQDRVAGQMFKIAGFEQNGNPFLPTQTVEEGDPTLNLFFELNGTVSSLDASNLDPYFEDLFESHEGKQLYFKIWPDMTSDPNTAEVVSGYAVIDEYFVDETSGVENNTAYTRGGIRLKPFPVKVSGDQYHPMIMTAWQMLKSELSILMYDPDLGNQPQNNGARLGALRRLVGAFGEITNLFRNFYKKASSRAYASQVDLTKSVIRLNSPDKIKYGGGIRVKQITLADNWTEEETPTYGTIYDYTKEESGAVVSSGVASNEPEVGNDESALRYARFYTQDLKAGTDNYYYHEHPYNEALFPGARVGYSQVTVKSLASDYAERMSKGQNIFLSGDPNTPLDPGIASSGKTIHEFYTARDFPVVVSETKLNRKAVKTFDIIPGVGFLRQEKFTGTQGYAIEFNNMHGKPKQVTNYAQDDQGAYIEEPVSWVRYDYQEEEEVYTLGNKQRKRKRLNNDVQILFEDPMDDSAIVKAGELGVEREFTTDIRDSRVTGANVGLDFNTEILAGVPPIPLFYPWLENSLSIKRLRTAVSNKIIRKSGILKSVVAKDGQSIVQTDNLVYDALSGQAVLTSVNNNFDDPVFNYSMPAHLAYEGMGPAYENMGLEFELLPSQFVFDENCGFYRLPVGALATEVEEALTEGDEFILTYTDANSTVQKRKAVFVAIDAGGARLFYTAEVDDPVGLITFHVSRSGKRNLLAANATAVTALANPLESRSPIQCTANVPLNSVSSGSFINRTNDYVTIDSVLNSSVTTYSQVWDNEQSLCNIDSTRLPEVQSFTDECIWIKIQRDQFTCTPCPLRVLIEYDLYGVTTLETIDFVPNTLGPCAPPEEDCMLTTICAPYGAITNLRDVDREYSCPPGNTCMPDVQTVIPQLTGGAPIVVYGNANPYELGQKGVWRQKDSYSYVNERLHEQDPNTQNFDIAGIVNDVPVFDHDNPFFTHCDETDDWKKTDAITKYNNYGFAVESKNILGIHNSALYGYKDNLTIAVGTNTRHYEVGFEGFEEYTHNDFANANRVGMSKFVSPKSGNIDFQCNNMVNVTSVPYDIIGIYNGGEYVWIDKPFQTDDRLPDEITLMLIKEDGDETAVVAKVVGQSSTTVDGKFYTNIQIDDTAGCGVNLSDDYGGRASLNYCSSSCAIGPGGNGTFQSVMYDFFLDDPNGEYDEFVKWTVGNIVETYNASVATLPDIKAIMDLYHPEGEWEDDGGTVIYSSNENLDVSDFGEIFLRYSEQGIPGTLPLLVDPIIVTMQSNGGGMTMVPDDIFISNEAAHTGSKSLYVQNAFSYDQETMDFEVGEEYTISAWVHKPDMDVHSYGQSPSLTAQFPGLAGVYFADGPIIEGWQRITGTFTYEGGTMLLGFQPGNEPAYYDDIRMFPSRGNIQTYVYNPVNYRLTEILDNNNYFTRYLYNSEGTLIGVIKETTEGLRSIQETGSYIQDNSTP